MVKSKHTSSMNRRQFLRLTGLGVLGTAGVLAGCRTSGSASAPAGASTATSIPLSATATVTATATAPAAATTTPNVDVALALRAHPDEVAILPGRATRVWRYTGELLAGSADHLTPIPSYLGPLLRFRRGNRVRITFQNDIPDESIVHWHGLIVPEEMDGHPRFVVGQGERYEYEFHVQNRAGTYWYHPHPHGRTGPQVYMGMAGFFIVHDDEEEAAGLPQGDYDIPLVIQDRAFDSTNQLVYLDNGMQDQFMGFLGNTILVNGQPEFTLDVATRPYRLRLLNGSNSRIYKLAWSDGSPLTVIGTDGGLLERPVRRNFVTLAPAERVELWVDFSAYPVGTELVLQSLPFTGDPFGMGVGFGPGGMGGPGMGGPGMGGPGMGGGMGGPGMGGPAWAAAWAAGMGGGMGGPGMGSGFGPGGGMGMGSNEPWPQGAAFPVLRVRVSREERADLVLPERLSTVERLIPSEAVNRDRPRRFVFAMQRMAWTINGRIFQMRDVAQDERVRLGTTEIWELYNAPGGGMGMGGMALPNPVHLHGVQFQVLERRVDSSMRALWDEVAPGYVDDGWKDTVLLMPGETVTLIVRFADFPGLFLYHCHNLEHEDMGMMRNYLIEG
ncbi:MAG: multicopper oxidase family protein [Ardenticatenia bacterium]|nr:multicopper oxidase family protein [Ardenticatenia bacterium]